MPYYIIVAVIIKNNIIIIMIMIKIDNLKLGHAETLAKCLA